MKIRGWGARTEPVLTLVELHARDADEDDLAYARVNLGRTPRVSQFAGKRRQIAILGAYGHAKVDLLGRIRRVCTQHLVGCKRL